MMTAKRNPFHALAMALWPVMAVYTVLCPLTGGLPSWAVAAAALLTAALLMLRYRKDEAPSLSCEKADRAGRLPVAVLLGLILLVRLAAVLLLKVQPEGDYGVYYHTADMMARGTLRSEGGIYCDYIANFPHVAGYAWLLSMLFRLTGPGTLGYGLLNAVMGTVTAGLCGAVAGRLAGKKAELTALVLAGFWPSTVLYTPFAASEYPFTLMMLLAVWLFLLQWEERRPMICLAELLGLGLLLGLGSFIRPMAAILLVACALALLWGRADAMDGRCGAFLKAGWRRLLPMVAAYMLVSQLLGPWASSVIGRETSTGVTSGYSLMVGMNTESSGRWNDPDDQIRYSAYDETGTAAGAGQACMDIAKDRIRALGPSGVLDLMVRKFAVLWSEDSYAADGLNWYLTQQGAMTPRLQRLISLADGVNRLWYLLAVLLCLPYGLLCRRKKPDAGFVLPLFWLGTTALHLLMEVQSRYHYAVLPVIAVLAGCGTAVLLERLQQRR